ncbi:TetR/AcrR family transcriptional regulator [Amphibacillus sp. Q70]|uniref:TetR/AcrR family transcriptional regulator n=1 Tax=Amphibacillus sp. Q70 TaxID=3453416 RepID=UPI003F831A4A
MPKVSEKYLENRKNEIAKAAINVFAKKGYSNASMKDIIKEANVSRGGLYAHFENIDAVFIAALKYDDALQVNRLSISDPKVSLLLQLNAWIDKAVLSVQNKKVNLVRAKSEFFLSHDIEEVPYLRERHDQLSKNIQRLVKIGIEKGEFKKQIDVNSFAELLISMIDGVMLHQHYQYTSNPNLSAVLNHMHKAIENILI